MATAISQPQVTIDLTSYLAIDDVQDLSQICRLCGIVPPKPVFPLLGRTSQKRGILKKINKYLPVQVDETDPLPKTVCRSCFKLIIKWHVLSHRCVEVESLLKQRCVQPNEQNSINLNDNNYEDADTYTYNAGTSVGTLFSNVKNEIKTETADSPSLVVKKYQSVTNQKENIEKPQSIVVKNGKRYGVCNICKKNVLTASWRRHMRSHQSVKRFSCHTCGLGFSDSGNLSRHTKAIHSEHRPHCCHICHKKFSRNSHLQDHIKSHSDTREYVCDVCGKASKSSAALRMHRRIHENDYKFQCVYCESKFKRRGQLTAHVSVHTGEKAHACDCGKTFRLKSQLTSHARLHDVVVLG